MSLALKYRPKDFNEVIGNKETVNSLISLLNKEERPQVFLFTGPAGNGKTTFARIMANKLNCTDFNIVEHNISNDTGIEFVRKLEKQAVLKPLQGKYKAYILDEVHSMSKQAQSCILKLMEEPPTFCYFFLCTTNPEKLSTAIKTRCTTYHVQTLKEEEIKEVLKVITKGEEKRIPRDVMSQISKDCLGSARNAIKILEKIIDLDREEMLEASKQQAEKQNEVIELCRALLYTKEWKRIADIIKNLNEEPESIRRCILGYMQAVLLNKKDVNVYNKMVCFEKNYFDTGKAGLVLSCFEALHK